MTGASDPATTERVAIGDVEPGAPDPDRTHDRRSLSESRKSSIFEDFGRDAPDDAAQRASGRKDEPARAGKRIRERTLGSQ